MQHASFYLSLIEKREDVGNLESHSSPRLARPEKKHGNLAKIEIDEVLCFVSNVRAEVSANDAVPSWVVLFIELLFDERGNVLLNIIFFQRLGRTVDGVLLHVFRHVGVLNNCFTLSHVCEFFGLQERRIKLKTTRFLRCEIVLPNDEASPNVCPGDGKKQLSFVTSRK